MMLQCTEMLCTHIETSDPPVVLPEPLHPDGELLHEAAALVVAQWSAACREDGRQQDQDGQELRTHVAGQDGETLQESGPSGK